MFAVGFLAKNVSQNTKKEKNAIPDIIYLLKLETKTYNFNFGKNLTLKN
jgi:hypothetical protein